jgi:hypothetical protein
MQNGPDQQLATVIGTDQPGRKAVPGPLLQSTQYTLTYHIALPECATQDCSLGHPQLFREFAMGLVRAARPPTRFSFPFATLHRCRQLAARPWPQGASLPCVGACQSPPNSPRRKAARCPGERPYRSNAWPTLRGVRRLDAGGRLSKG